MSISSDEKGFKSLVLSGGGVRALAHVGAITRLEQLGMLTEFSNYCGASAGAGIAALLASGYTCEELFKFMITLDYRSFVNHNPIKEGIDLVRHFGLHSPNKLQDAFDKGLQAKVGENATFMSLYKRTGKTLIIPATNLTLGVLDVFSPSTSPDMLIKDALCLTTDIPLFFTAKTYNGHTYTDGGVLNNLPVGLVPQPSLAINLVAEQQLPQKTDNLSDYLYTLLETVTNKIESLESENRVGHVIKVNTGSVGATDFDITFMRKVSLVRRGFNATKNWYPPGTLIYPHLDKQMDPHVFPTYWTKFLQEQQDTISEKPDNKEKNTFATKAGCAIQ